MKNEFNQSGIYKLKYSELKKKSYIGPTEGSFSSWFKEHVKIQNKNPYKYEIKYSPVHDKV